RGDRVWRGMWDSVSDRFILPTASNFLIFDGNGVDVSPRVGTANALMDYGNFDFHSSGIVQDGRNAYVYDQAHGALYRFNLYQSPFQLVKVLDLPDTVWTGAGRGITLVWHPVLRAVVILGYGADYKGRMYAFEVDSGKLTGWARPDGFVNAARNWISPSTSFFDPDTGDVISIGGIDWDGMTSSVFWRLHLTQ